MKILKEKRGYDGLTNPISNSRLLKLLLRYYYPIDPETVASYIIAYREMYDDKYQMEVADHAKKTAKNAR